MGKIVGIDLGTTNSVVAIMDGPQPRVLDSKEGRRQTRSVVSLKRRRGGGDGELIAGDPAVDNWALCPRDTVISIKRLMGRGVGDPEVQKVKESVQYEIVEPSDGTRDSVRVLIGGKEYSPIDVSAIILRKLKEDAEFRLGGEVTHAVITVPAYFSQIQKDATRKAGLQAGLHVIKILDEPTAAAIAYGLDSGGGSDATTLVVYDLGGGTFDISVLMMAGGTFAPLDLEGDMWLGGDNFDLALIEHALASLREDYPDVDPRANPRFMVELRRAAQRAKEALGASRSAELIVAGMLQDAEHNLVDLDLEVTREEYERMVAPLVDRTRSLVAKALANASLTPDQVDYVLMTGNSTANPQVQRVMEETFGAEKVLRRIHPKECVAIGAAIVGAVIGASHTVCICGELNDAGADACKACGRSLVAEEESLPGGVVADLFGQLGDVPAPGESPSTTGTAATPTQFIVGGGLQDTTVVGVAPFSYGAQGVGDTMTVFVEKNEPYPTADPRVHVFKTQAPNARIISIPIYGGDDHENASANERQGNAFAILPPGLPAHTPVRVKLWLDEGGNWQLSAELQNGLDLQPWVMVKGEQQERAIAELDEAERILGQKAAAADPRELAKIEALREEVFAQMKAGEFAEALATVRRLRDSTEVLGAEDAAQAVRTKAEQLIGFTTSIAQHYAWAFDPARRDELLRLAGELRAALKSGDAALLAAKVEELDRETDDLPDAVKVLLGVRGAIRQRIAPQNPAAARGLESELAQIEDGLAAMDEAAFERLGGFLQEVLDTMMRIPEYANGVPCSNGHLIPPGEHICPVCGEDMWKLIA